MANRYWVTGGTGNWNSTTNWSTATGGASCASVPSTGDAAIFDTSSGSGTATLDISPTVQTVNLTGFAGTLAFGTNNISVNSTGTVWTQTTSCTITGTPVVNITNNSSTTINAVCTSVTESNSVSINITAATGQVGTSGSFKNIDCTGFSGTFSNSVRTIYGNLKLVSAVTVASGTNLTTFAATSGTQQVTTAGLTLDFPITLSGTATVQLQDAITLGTARAFTFTAGTLDLNNKTLSTGTFASSNTNTRTLAFGTGNITCTGTSSAWNTGTVTGLTITGNPVVNVTNSGSTGIIVTTGALSEANSISYNFTGGTYALTFLNAAGYTAKNVDFTGFAGTLNAISSTIIYGNLNISSGMTITASGGALSFGATSGTKTITTNGKTLDFPITINGSGGTFQLQDALTQGSTRQFTLQNGTLDLNGKTLTVGTGFVTGVGTKNLTFNSGTLVCPAATTTAFSNTNATGFTTTAGTGAGTISMTAATAKTFVGNNINYAATLQNAGAGALTVSGSNTFTGISNSVQPTTFTFTSGTTQTVTNWNVSGTSGNLVTINATSTTAATLSKSTGIVSSDFLAIDHSTATGGATWYAGANSTNNGTNTGWIFSAAPSGNKGNFLMFF